MNTRKAQFLRVFEAHGFVTPSLFAAESGMTVADANTTIGNHYRAGNVQRIGHGKYVPVPGKWRSTISWGECARAFCEIAKAGFVDARKLAAQMGITRRNAADYLIVLARKGLARRVAHGRYALPQSAMGER